MPASEVDVSTWLTPSIKLHIPILSAAMDTVTESKTAICLAQEGGIGIIHRNMGVTEQAQEVEKVKKSESGMIVDPITISPEQKIKHARSHGKIPHIGHTGNKRKKIGGHYNEQRPPF